MRRYGRRRPGWRAPPVRWAGVPILLVALIAALLQVSPAEGAGGASAGAATTDASPVDLATHVDMADGMAHRSAVVRAGDARIEVLSPTLLRLEYSPSANFENRPTVNAIDRRLPVPPYPPTSPTVG